jgi:hypothetical protein
VFRDQRFGAQNKKQIYIYVYIYNIETRRVYGTVVLIDVLYLLDQEGKAMGVHIPYIQTSSYNTYYIYYKFQSIVSIMAESKDQVISFSITFYYCSLTTPELWQLVALTTVLKHCP